MTSITSSSHHCISGSEKVSKEYILLFVKYQWLSFGMDAAKCRDSLLWNIQQPLYNIPPAWFDRSSINRCSSIDARYCPNPVDKSLCSASLPEAWISQCPIPLNAAICIETELEKRNHHDIQYAKGDLTLDRIMHSIRCPSDRRMLFFASKMDISMWQMDSVSSRRPFDRVDFDNLCKSNDRWPDDRERKCNFSFRRSHPNNHCHFGWWNPLFHDRTSTSIAPTRYSRRKKARILINLNRQLKTKKPSKIAYTSYGVFDATATMRHKFLVLADEIVNLFDWQREFRQSQKRSQIGRVKRCQNRDEYPPRRENETRRAGDWR